MAPALGLGPSIGLVGTAALAGALLLFLLPETRQAALPD
jgi:hypothetical protein